MATTRVKYIEEMEKLYNNGRYDTEEAHIKADELLCELLKELGYNELIEVYEKIGKWYA